MHMVSYPEDFYLSITRNLRPKGNMYVQSTHGNRISKFNLNTWQLPGTTAWLIDTSDILQSAQCLSSVFSDWVQKRWFTMSIPLMSKIPFHLLYIALKCWELSCGSKTLLILKGKKTFLVWWFAKKKKKWRRHNLCWHTHSSYAFFCIVHFVSI